MVVTLWLKSGFQTVVIVAFALLLLFGVAVATGLMQLPLVNIQREVTTHSQAYIQTHQTMMLDYYADYQRASDDAHRNAARLEVCAEAALLDESEWPAQAAPFIYANCR